VKRIIILDAGYVGLACDKPKPSSEGDIFRFWMIQESSTGSMIVIPEIADYETRRSLILAESWASVARLDALFDPSDRNRLATYCGINTTAMRKAAGLWAEARRRGEQTDVDSALDGDVILAAQAMGYCSDADDWMVATDNVRHVSRYVKDRARTWRTIANERWHASGGGVRQ
jgi:hypothetical protein